MLNKPWWFVFSEGGGIYVGQDHRAQLRFNNVLLWMKKARFIACVQKYTSSSHSDSCAAIEVHILSLYDASKLELFQGNSSRALQEAFGLRLRTFAKGVNILCYTCSQIRLTTKTSTSIGHKRFHSVNCRQAADFHRRDTKTETRDIFHLPTWLRVWNWASYRSKTWISGLDQSSVFFFVKLKSKVRSTAGMYSCFTIQRLAIDKIMLRSVSSERCSRQAETQQATVVYKKAVRALGALKPQGLHNTSSALCGSLYQLHVANESLAWFWKRSIDQLLCALYFHVHSIISKYLHFPLNGKRRFIRQRMKWREYIIKWFILFKC